MSGEEIGLLKLCRIGIGAGLRRIEALTAPLLEWFAERNRLLEEAAARLKSDAAGAGKIAGLQQELEGSVKTSCN